MSVAVTALLLAAPTSHFRNVGIAGQRTGADANDFYYYRGAPVHLDRSLSEIVVRFGTKSPIEQQKAIQAALPEAKLGPAIPGDEGPFRVVTLQRRARDAAELEAVVKRLRALDPIDFVAPVFLHPATGARLVPTDEIVVKLTAGTTTADIKDLLVARSLVIVRRMVGSSNEYVMRLSPGQGADPLAESRLLYESGHFEWVEPNFVQDLLK